MCCHPSLTPGLRDRPDAARGRRPDDGPDRERLPRPRGDDGPAHLAGEADDQGRPACPSAAGGRRAAGPAAHRAPGALPHLQRGLREQRRRPSSSASTSSDEAIRIARMLERRLPDDPEVAGCSRSCCSSMRGARRAPTPTASSSRSPSRTDRSGTGPRSPRAPRFSIAAIDRGRVGEYQFQAAIAALHDRAPTRRRHRLAADPRPVRAARAGDRQSDRDAQPCGRGRDGRRPGGGPGAPRRRSTARLSTTGSTRSAPTCSRWPATTEAAMVPTARPRDGRPACPSSAT